jgi:hypothetical protein
MQDTKYIVERSKAIRKIVSLLCEYPDIGLAEIVEEYYLQHPDQARLGS